MLHCNRRAFAAVKSNGSVVAWGSENCGGDATSIGALLAHGVREVRGNGAAFAALTKTGAVIAWGDPERGGDATSVAADLNHSIVQLYCNRFAFAALTDAGRVITWGGATAGGDSANVQAELKTGVVTIYSTGHAFAALKDAGSVITWGDPWYGADSMSVRASLLNGVSSVLGARSAFAALKRCGSSSTGGYAGNMMDCAARGNASIEDDGGHATAMQCHSTSVADHRDHLPPLVQYYGEGNSFAAVAAGDRLAAFHDDNTGHSALASVAAEAAGRQRIAKRASIAVQPCLRQSTGRSTATASSFPARPSLQIG